MKFVQHLIDNYKYQINPINKELNRFTFIIPVTDLVELTKLDSEHKFLSITDSFCFPSNNCQFTDKVGMTFDAFPMNVGYSGDVELTLFTFSPYNSVEHFLQCLFSANLDSGNDIYNYKYVYLAKENIWVDWNNVTDEALAYGVKSFKFLKSEYIKDKESLKNKYISLIDDIKYDLNLL